MVTLSFNAKMVLANFECNLNDQGLPEMAPRRWPVLCGNVEGADLKKNSQSITRIDPKVGTGGMLRVLKHIMTFGKAGKHRHLLAVCLTKGQAYVLKQLLVFQLIPHNTCSLHNPSQVCFQNMCHFHGWPQQLHLFRVCNVNTFLLDAVWSTG